MWWWHTKQLSSSLSPEERGTHDTVTSSGVFVIDGIEVQGSERLDVTHIFGDTALGGSPNGRIEIDGYGQMYYMIDAIDGNIGHTADEIGSYTWRDENGQVYTVIQSDGEGIEAYEGQ